MAGQHFDVPGASLGDSYKVPPVSGADALLTDVLADTGDALATWTEGELRQPADPGLINVRNAIRAEYQAAADDWAARKKAYYEGPNRKRYSKEGRDAADQEFESQLAADRIALRDRLGKRLDVVEQAIRTRLDHANVVSVGEGEEGAAVLFAAKLSHVTPRHGGAVLADFVLAATENPGLAYEALPLLRSAHDQGPWQGDYSLALAIETLQRVVEARPGAARAAADLKLLDETRHQLGYLEDAATSQLADRFVMNTMGDEVPVQGHAGMAVEWSASPTAREMFGNGPTLSGTEPVIAAPSAPDDGVVESWRPVDGIQRGRRPAYVPDDDVA